MEMMAEAWSKKDKLSPEYGKFLIWNASKGMYAFNNSKYMKYGLNAMYALDGFLQSMLGTAHARGLAYDTLMEQGFRNSADFSSKFDDLAKSGIIDPVKVVRTALENAASIASMLLTTECVVADEPEDDMPAPPMGGGMPGGMPGMM